jgi:hypothetical protein
MATSKKHIAVYLDPAVQQALSDFCEQRGLKSKNGVVFSAGVNTALAEFFGIPVKAASDIPVKAASDIPVKAASDIPVKAASDIPVKAASDIPVKAASSIPVKAASSIPVKAASSIPVKAASSIPTETFAVEVLPGKFRA